VFERRALVLIAARHDSLRSYVDGTHTVTVDGAVAAFINPMIDLSQRGDPGWQSYFALLVAKSTTPPGAAKSSIASSTTACTNSSTFLQKALPGSPKKELYWAYNFLAGSDDAGTVRY